MKILALTAENVKRLRAVHIEPDPDGHLVVVAGANAQGKTSVLDSIWLALGGGAAGKGTPIPIREGETQARVSLDLGDLKVTRTWTGDKTALKVENADGARYGSPQSMLDALVGRLSFDPLTFAQQDEKTQRATLLSLVELPFDPDELDALRRGAFEQRTELNRQAKALRAQLDAIPDPEPDLPAEEQSLSDLLDEAQKARGYRERAQRIREDHALHQGNLDRAFDLLQKAYEAIDLAERDLADSQEALDNIPTDLPDPAAIEARIRDLEQTNQKVRTAQHRRRLASDADALDLDIAELTERLEEIDAQKVDGLAAAAMPLDGLAFDDTGVTYQGVPLKQASAAEQLRVSIAMAMALNPKVRVIRITDGSLLDSRNLALIEEMARANDFQVWIERVDETGHVGIVIEDGQVAEHPAPSLAGVQ